MHPTAYTVVEKSTGAFLLKLIVVFRKFNDHRGLPWLMSEWYQTPANGEMQLPVSGWGSTKTWDQASSVLLLPAFHDTVVMGRCCQSATR